MFDRCDQSCQRSFAVVIRVRKRFSRRVSFGSNLCGAFTDSTVIQLITDGLTYYESNILNIIFSPLINTCEPRFRVADNLSIPSNTKIETKRPFFFL